MKKLPEKASDLLELALNDVAKLRKKGHKLYAYSFVEKRQGKPCMVCLGGAVMIATLKRKYYLRLSRDARFAMDEIDSMRCGLGPLYATSMGAEIRASSVRGFAPIRVYRKAVKFLREHGK